MADGNGALGDNVYRADRNLQALLQRSAPWLTDDDTERLSSFGGWVATAVDEQADYTKPLRAAGPRKPWMRTAAPVPWSATIRSTPQRTARSTSVASSGSTTARRGALTR